jgi:hypothetical protein
MMQIEVIFKHLLTIVGKLFRRVAASFAVTFLIAAGATEVVAGVLTKTFPPSALTHVTAAVIGFGWGLVVGLAVAIEEGLRGFVLLIEEVAKATEKAVVSVGKEIGKEGGQLLHSAGNVVQSVERGAATAVRDVAHIPGEIAGGVEHAAQRLTGRDQTPN